jgi:hypothetical protein
MRAGRWIAAMLAAALTLGPQPVRAQEGEARSLFELGVEAVEAGRYAEAEELLARSLATQPRLSTAYNLAIARRGIGDALGARAVLRDIVGGTYGPIPAAQRDTIEALLDESQARIARLTIELEAAPPGARLSIDGRPVSAEERGAGALGIEVEVSPGARQVVAIAPDHEPVERTIELAPGASERISLRLAPQIDRRPGILEVATGDRSTSIVIVGHARGHGEVRTEVPPGEHVVRLARGGRERESRVMVPAGRRVRLVLAPPEPASDDAPWIAAGIASGVLVLGAVIGIAVGVGTYQPQPVAAPDWPTVEL